MGVAAMCLVETWSVSSMVIIIIIHNAFMPLCQVLLVVGGYRNYPNDLLDSTELLVPGSGAWRLATGLLPRHMEGMRVANVGNVIFLTGWYILYRIYI